MEKISNSVKITLIIVVGVLLLGLLSFNFFRENTTLNVNGNSVVKAVPNLVVIYFNIETKASTSQEAKDNNAEIVNELTNNLVNLGFEKKNIVTENYNINENCEWKSSGKICNGYVATHSIKIEMPAESDKAGQVIDAGVNAGATISYINFELSQEMQNQYKSQAINLAAQDAKIKAESLASGLGKEVGDLISVSVDNFYYSPWRLYESAGVADSDVAKESVTNIQPGEREISASVNAVFKLK